jgi:hypothetical protein
MKYKAISDKDIIRLLQKYNIKLNAVNPGALKNGVFRSLNVEIIIVFDKMEETFSL